MRCEPLGIPYIGSCGSCDCALYSHHQACFFAGESIPVRCEPLDIGYIDGMLLLPLIIEHTIGEAAAVECNRISL